jgi:CBS domain-containing protein
MMRRNIRHLCVTEDGTPHTKVIGIISEHDILLLHGNNPAVLAKEIAQATDVRQLAAIRDRAEQLAVQYISRGNSVRFVSDLIAEINDALIARLLTLGERVLEGEGLENPGVRYCWLSYGSEGRKEQILRTDQDTALVYEDPPGNLAEEAQRYFRRLGEEMTGDLATCGFALCPGKNMASNPQWCQPLSVWKKYIHGWIRVPNEDALLHAAIFFDFRPVHGHLPLALAIRECISEELRQDRTALILLAKNALRNPSPVGLRKRLNVERTGSRKGLFDLKLRALKPLTDATRVLALDRGIHAVTGTSERVSKLAEIDASIRDIGQDLLAAYEVLVRSRVLFGARDADRGRYVEVAAMSKPDLGRLQSAFEPVKELLALIKIRYQLDALGLG